MNHCHARPYRQRLSVSRSSRPLLSLSLAIIPALAWLLVVMWAPFAQASVPISVEPDRNPVQLNESFNLIFSAADAPDADPDFSPLNQDFEILSQGQSNQINMINGRLSRKTQWTVSVAAKREGTLTVPAIAFGSDRSEPVTVQVNPESGPTSNAGSSNQNEELFVETEAEPKNPYVQAQVLLTVRVFQRVNLAGANLSEPAVTGAVIDRLGDDRRYVTERNGEHYSVTERKYAIFPQKSGLLKIPSIHLDARVTDGRSSAFDPFFNPRTRTVRVKSEPIDLQIRPVPSSFLGKHWLPAEKVVLEDSWADQPPSTRAGEPITRTITLRADGATVGLLPELGTSLGGQQKEIKQYPDQPATNEEKRITGVTSSRQEKVALIPAKPGEYVLPAVEISWWNTRMDRPETARLPERRLTVEASSEQNESNPPTPPAVVPQPNQTVTPESAPSAPPLLATAPLLENMWFWLTMLCATGWLATALAWRLKTRHGAKRPQSATLAQSYEPEAFRELMRACGQGEPEKIRDGLLRWGQSRWPQTNITSLASLGLRLGDPMIQTELAKLEQALYGRVKSAWSSEELQRLLKTLHSRETGAKAEQDRRLEPLYKV